MHCTCNHYVLSDLWLCFASLTTARRTCYQPTGTIWSRNLCKTIWIKSWPPRPVSCIMHRRLYYNNIIYHVSRALYSPTFYNTNNSSSSSGLLSIYKIIWKVVIFCANRNEIMYGEPSTCPDPGITSARRKPNA